jgi:hypothetical protein
VGARDQLVLVEGLGQIVVGAAAEGLDLGFVEPLRALAGLVPLPAAPDFPPPLPLFAIAPHLQLIYLWFLICR